MKLILAPLAGAMMHFGAAAMAQSGASDTTKETGALNSTESYFKDNREPLDPAMTMTYEMGAAIPASVRVYEFRNRPDLVSYRYFSSGGSYYVLDGDRRVVRTFKPQNK